MMIIIILKSLSFFIYVHVEQRTYQRITCDRNVNQQDYENDVEIRRPSFQGVSCAPNMVGPPKSKIFKYDFPFRFSTKSMN